jgi:hypothetical protein
MMIFLYVPRVGGQRRAGPAVLVIPQQHPQHETDAGNHDGNYRSEYTNYDESIFCRAAVAIASEITTMIYIEDTPVG